MSNEHYDPEFEARQKAKEAGLDEIKEFLIEQGTDPTNYLGLGAGKAGSLVGKAALATYGMLKGEDAQAAFLGGRLLNKNMLKVAQKALKDGHNEIDIFKLTGYFKNPRGEWRYYVPETDVKANPDRLFKIGPKKLGDVIENPNLYKEVPSLADVKVKRLKGPETDRGEWDPRTLTVGINPALDAAQMARTGSHETTHVIQNIGRVDGGGSSSQFLPDTFDWGAEKIDFMERTLTDVIKKRTGLPDAGIHEAVKTAEIAFGHRIPQQPSQLQQALEFKQTLGRDPQTASLFKQLIDARKAKLASLNKQRDAFRKYENIPGEVEARAAANTINRDIQKEGIHPSEFYAQEITDPMFYQNWGHDDILTDSLDELLKPLVP